MAVRYYVNGGVNKTDAKKKERLQKESEKLHVTYVNLKNKIQDKFLLRKSKLVTCPECFSKLSVSHLKDTNCPVCRTDMLSASDKKRIESSKKKYQDAVKKFKHFKPRTSAKGKSIAYAIGGYCSS
jgi:hypothetical protein